MPSTLVVKKGVNKLCATSSVIPSPKSSTENERTTLVFETLNHGEVMIRQIAGAVARRIAVYVKPGQPISVGEDVGFIRFGSRVDIFLPLDAEVLCKIGDKPSGGETVIARLQSN